MRCKTVQKHLVAYADTELNEQEHLQVDSHLSACGTCRQALALLEATRPGPGTPQEHPPEFWAPMHEAVLRELDKPTKRTHRLHWALLYTGLLALALFWVLRGPTNTAPSTHSTVPPTQAATLPIQP